MNASLGCWREEFNENIKQYLIQNWPTLNKTFVTSSFFKNTPHRLLSQMPNFGLERLIAFKLLVTTLLLQQSVNI